MLAALTTRPRLRSAAMSRCKPLALIGDRLVVWTNQPELTREKWHPARGRCLTSNVTLGSSKSEPRGKSEVFDELPWQTRVVGAGGASL